MTTAACDHNAGFLDGECIVCMRAERDRLLESVHRIHMMAHCPDALNEACRALECARKANAISQGKGIANG